MFRLVLNHHMTKYSKFWANGTWKGKRWTSRKAIPWIASSKASDQKSQFYSLPFAFYTLLPFITLGMKSQPNLETLHYSYSHLLFSSTLWGEGAGLYVCQSRMSYFGYVAEDRTRVGRYLKKWQKKWDILYERSQRVKASVEKNSGSIVSMPVSGS